MMASNALTPGDVVLICNSGRIRFAGEIAAKVRNPRACPIFLEGKRDRWRVGANVLHR